jgi:hypothetical protein
VFPQWIGGWTYLCFGSLRLREFSDHGRQGSCAREEKRNTVKQAQAVASDPTEHQLQAPHHDSRALDYERSGVLRISGIWDGLDWLYLDGKS